MIHDDLAGLSLFALVAEKRSFTAAAAALRVTPSAVSQAVSALERRIGVRLLQRTTRSVGVTEAGEWFLTRLGPALRDVRAAIDGLDELRDRPAGTLRLNVPRVAYRRCIAPKLDAFVTRYPEIALEITLEDALANIVERGFDAGIRLGESIERDMVAVRISQDDRVAVVASPAYFAQNTKPKRPRDLQSHRCIRYRRITGGDVYRWELTQDGKDIEVAVDGPIVTNDAEVMIDAALSGIGIAHVLESMVERELADKRLVRVLSDFCPPFRGYFLYYPTRTLLPAKLRVLVDFLRIGGDASKRKRARQAPASGAT